ncbi:oligosaccharide flippase family protein [Natronorubrum sp. JWXQ-INN-674]|uniref:Oligosaccharide flippase family protein n=1 Tax=Natronorubrum halalkaliphilum TaxID=2691917 RepID=A0A6B0VJ35_9EURY|nr:flippase [Natronorubrum halalkaliphilum]MXV60956.1 oligosaccharide flippase family protein [Natronorubrum halalkaliphilum]
MSLTSKLGDRFKAEFMGQIIAVVSSALLTLILARILNPDGYGLLFLATSVLGTIQLFSKLGIAKSAARFIAEYKETNPSQLPHIVRFAFILNVVTVIIVCVSLLISHELLATVIGEPDLASLLSLGILFIAFGTFVTFVRIILQGFEDIKPAAALHAIDRGSRLVFAVGLVLLGYGAFGALMGYVLAHILVAIIGLIYIYHHHLWPKNTSTSIETGIRRRIAEYTIPLTATSTANVLDKRVDTILIGFFSGPVGVAYYTIGKQVISFIETPMSALGFTLSPMYEVQKAKGKSETAARIYEEGLVHGLLLYIPAAAGLVLVADPMVELFFGSNYLGAVPILQVLSIYAVLQSVTRLTSNGLDFLGRARERAIVKGITSVLNVALNIVLIPLIGVVGAAFATVTTYSIYTLANVYIIHTELNLRIIFILRRMVATLAITGVMSLPIYFTVDFINSFVGLFLVVGVGIAIWAILAVSSGLLDIARIISTLS